jgi:hypothetical protein
MLVRSLRLVFLLSVVSRAALSSDLQHPVISPCLGTESEVFLSKTTEVIDVKDTAQSPS